MYTPPPRREAARRASDLAGDAGRRFEKDRLRHRHRSAAAGDDYLPIERALESGWSSGSTELDPIEPRARSSSIVRPPGSVEFGSVAVPSSDPLPLSLPVLELPPSDPSSGFSDRSGCVGEFGLLGEPPELLPLMPPVAPPIEEPAEPPPAWAHNRDAENRTPATADRPVLFMDHLHCDAAVPS
jgi:hypothetical protein